MHGEIASEPRDDERVLWRGPVSALIAAPGGPAHGALEVLTEPSRSSTDARARFESRARALLHVDIEHVATVVGIADGAARVRWVEGESLEGVAGRELPPQVAAAIVRDVARGIAALHERGLMHGSLGTHSIVIDGAGRARIVDAVSAPVARSMAALVSSVRAHAAPELDAGPAADVWALGSLLHELLLGEPPGETVLAPAERRTGVPESLDFAVMHALRRTPGERPTARALAELIAEALDDRDIGAEVVAWLAQPASGSGAAHRAALPAGALIAGTYHVDGVLGRGGMGIVHAATHVGMRRPVAIKVLLAHATRAPRLVQRFVREARIAGALDHPGVVRIYDLGHDGRPYLVMERLEGETLRARLDRGPLGVADAVRVAARVAGALAHAHLRGVIHRDVKPENVFLARRSDGTERVVLLDFGISKLETDDAITMTGAVIGTPRYLAPEQARGSREVGPATDVYHLGVLIHEMLSGRTPIDASDPVALLVALDEGRRERLRQACPRAPRWLERLVDRATAREPRDRFADAAELARAMAQHVALDEVTARELAVPQRAAAPRWTWILAALLAAIAIVLALGMSRGGEPRDMRSAHRAVVVRVPVPIAIPVEPDASTADTTASASAPSIEPPVQHAPRRPRAAPSEPPPARAPSAAPAGPPRFTPTSRAGALSADDL